MKLFAYLNIDRPMIAWEVAIGRFNSVVNDTMDNKGCISMWLYSDIRGLSKNIFYKKIFFEYDIELYRQKKYPKAVSRLTGLYLFKTKEDAMETLLLWGWEVKEEYISEIDFNSKNMTVVDSDWITYRFYSEDKTWINKYWEGQPYSANPHWEVISEGNGIILNKSLRELAYKKIYYNQGEITPILATSICAFASTDKYSEVSRIKPFIYVEDNKLKGGYIMEGTLLKENQKEIAELCLYYISKNEFPSVIFPGDGDYFAKVINLENEFFEINLDETAIKILDSVGIKGKV